MRREFLCQEALLNDCPPPWWPYQTTGTPHCLVFSSPFWNLDGSRGQLG